MTLNVRQMNERDCCDKHVKKFVSPVVCRIHEEMKNNDFIPYFVTTSFVPVDASIKQKIEFCYKSYAKFYRHLTSRLMTNYTRKFHLHPRTFEFIDFPNTKHNRPHTNEPKTPHIHSVFLIHPDTQSKFEMMMCEEFQEIVTHRDMRSIIQCYAERITDTKDDITRLVSYASKFLQMRSATSLLNDVSLMNQYPITRDDLATRKTRKEQIHRDIRRETLTASQNHLLQRFPTSPDALPDLPSINPHESRFHASTTLLDDAREIS